LSSKTAMNLFSVWDSNALEIAHDHFILRRQSENRTVRLHQRKQKARKNMAARKFSCKATEKGVCNQQRL
jgi:hypothetical protein